MLFNSIDFAIFLPIVFILYWFVTNRSLRWQNLLIVASSFVFYGWWDWRFLILLVASSVVDYFVGIALAKQDNRHKRKLLLAISLITNLGLLGFFKYYNFFVDSFVDAFSFFGHSINLGTLNIVLPVGISFYTFQILSYSIDIYRRKLEPTRDVVAFFAFVSFFPQLVAGPIERASNLLPQFFKKRIFDQAKAVDGLRQILWGLFKKIVIADNCAEYVNIIFNSSASHPGSVLVIGAAMFAIQIYADFSGYSDIGIGTARLFGFNLMQNFNFPFFSRDIGEFWRRWHISLSTWFKDYVYIPLGGSRGGLWLKARNIFIVYMVSGLWHGANWTFVVWGFLNALYFLPLILTNNHRNHIGVVAQGKIFPSIKEILQICFTFIQVTFSLIFFRSSNIEQAFQIIKSIFSTSLFSIPQGATFIGTTLHPFVIISAILAFFIIEWIGRGRQYAIENVGVCWPRAIRWAVYYLIIVAIFWLGAKGQQYIYFQF